MNEITTVGLDLAKRVVSLCGEDGSGHVVVQRTLRREAVLGWFAAAPGVPGRDGGVRDRALVRPRADCHGPQRADHRAGVCTTVPVVGEERCARRASDLRAGTTAAAALRDGEERRAAGAAGGASAAVNRLTGRHLDPPFADAVLLYVLAFVVVQSDADLVLEHGGYVVGAARVCGQTVGEWRSLKNVGHRMPWGSRILHTTSITLPYAGHPHPASLHTNLRATRRAPGAHFIPNVRPWSGWQNTPRRRQCP